MRRLCNYVLTGYIGLLAIAFIFMQISRTFFSIMIFVLLTMPWSGWLGLYLYRDGHAPELANNTFHLWFDIACLLGAGLVNVIILFGISRLFKKSN